jgi:ParB-like chromosome segregation protein Spo0J
VGHAGASRWATPWGRARASRAARPRAQVKKVRDACREGGKGREREREREREGEGEGSSPWDPKTSDNRLPDHLGQRGGREVE